MFLKTGHSLVLNVVKRLARDRRKTELSCVSRIQGFSSEDTSNTYGGFSLGDRYTIEEQDVILGKINTCTIDELKRYRITERRLKKITAYRDKHGSFKSVEEILLLHGMATSVFEKFFKSLVNNTSRNAKIFKSVGDLLRPALTEEIRSASRTYTGVWICDSLISWAQVDRDSNLLHWKCQTIEEAFMKEGLVAGIEVVASIVSNVPQSDAYIMDSDPIIPFSQMNSATYTVHLQKQQITSAVVSILGMREKRFGDQHDYNTLINNIYMMRSRVPARLFNLLVGSEIVSAKTVVEEMIEDRGEHKGEDIFHIYANSDMKKYYKKLNAYQREQMNWALLLTLAFLDLYILKRTFLININRKRQQTGT